MQHDGRRQRVYAWLTIAVAAFLAVLPMALYGCSCGHDFDFHLRSWMEAAAQIRHGVLRPVWAFSPAYGAGEPRLLFYPPLSWYTGALLTLLLPWKAAPITFMWLVLALNGLTMHTLLRRLLPPGWATLGGCLYLVNPYMLFVIYERSAYAELMAAAWMPLLLDGMLRTRTSWWRIAIPIALLWLTNAPAAVVGSYSVLLLGIVRLVLMGREGRASLLRFAGTVTAGVVAGLLFDSFYLIPLAVERRYVQLDLAVVPNAQPAANFLFGYYGNAFHDQVLMEASWIAVWLAGIAVCCCAVLLLVRARVESFGSMHDRQAQAVSTRSLALTLLAYTALVFLLLTRLSERVWDVAPELVFLQFPWRFLTMQGAVTTALFCLALHRVIRMARMPVLAGAGVLVAVLAAFVGANPHFREECADDERPEAQMHDFTNGDSTDPTDEYTAVDADNDLLKINDPPAWLASQPEADAKGTGNGALVSVTDGHPGHFFWTASGAPYLIVRLRRFPGWHVTRDGAEATALPHRGDGLTVVPLPPGQHTVEVRYRTTWDQWTGGGVSALAICGALLWRRRRSGAAAASV